uniref:Serine/arginine-rich splicing factor 12 n=1 Tax=Anthurium amnicola TaxID=1678845 RepID=A0A1D1YCJ2_9ARAE
MRRYSPQYSPPRRGYGGRGRSPPRRGYGGYGGRREQSRGSLLVRNIPLNCRPEDLRVPFERFGPVRDVYLPKDYYTGDSRGFAFVEFINPHDASEAQYHMDRRVFGGREITVVAAAETRKRPEEMRHRTRARYLAFTLSLVILTFSVTFFLICQAAYMGLDLFCRGSSGSYGRHSSYYGRMLLSWPFGDDFG